MWRKGLFLTGQLRLSHRGRVPRVSEFISDLVYARTRYEKVINVCTVIEIELNEWKNFYKIDIVLCPDMIFVTRILARDCLR